MDLGIQDFLSWPFCSWSKTNISRTKSIICSATREKRSVNLDISDRSTEKFCLPHKHSNYIYEFFKSRKTEVLDPQLHISTSRTLVKCFNCHFASWPVSQFVNQIKQKQLNKNAKIKNKRPFRRKGTHFWTPKKKYNNHIWDPSSLPLSL